MPALRRVFGGQGRGKLYCADVGAGSAYCRDPAARVPRRGADRWRVLPGARPPGDQSGRVRSLRRVCGCVSRAVYLHSENNAHSRRSGSSNGMTEDVRRINDFGRLVLLSAILLVAGNAQQRVGGKPAAVALLPRFPRARSTGQDGRGLGHPATADRARDGGGDGPAARPRETAPAGRADKPTERGQRLHAAETLVRVG